MGDLRLNNNETKIEKKADISELVRLVDDLEKPKNQQIREKLESDLDTAKAIIRQNEIKAKVASLHFDSGAIRTLKQMNNPGPKTHDVIIAFFLLLGEYEGKTRVNLLIIDILYDLVLEGELDSSPWVTHLLFKNRNNWTAPAKLFPSVHF